ncbi:MAG: divalent-cation tolerance protein CutA [Xanthomonadales bacterium]|jgi:periplasmic divalent cation tolerance protein|nr:divalent-cation tolerance protein CutA [Xanthomonadales bacterium]
MADELRILLTTLPALDPAENLAAILIDEGLAACVQILPGMLSIYRWQGQRVRDSECLVLVKTQAGHLARCEQRLAALHPYECPEIVSLRPDKVNGAYLRWLTETTLPPETEG